MKIFPKLECAFGWIPAAGFALVGLVTACGAALLAGATQAQSAPAPSLFQPPTAAQSIARVTPWDFGARPGDCSADASNALMRAAREAIERGAILWTGDGCLAIARTFVPPPGLIWRSDFSDAHRLIWTGPRGVDVVEVTAPIDLDGVVIDGGRSARLNRFSATLAGNERRALLAIHGSMATDHPAPLAGVRIGRVRVENSGWSTGVLAVNLRGLQVDRIEARSIWGVATMWAGVSSSSVGVVAASDTGQFGQEGARSGQVVAIYAETDPRKQPGKFFVLADQNKPSRNILETRGLAFGRIETRANTDTAVYVHDYQGGRAGQGIDLSAISIDSIIGDLVGKDLFKVRNFAGNVSVGAITGTRIGARIVAVEDHAHDVTIGSITGSQFGYDVVGDMNGGTARFDGVDHGRGIGFGQTLSTNAAAVSIIGGVQNVRINSGSVRGVPALWNGKNGYGLIVSDADTVNVRLAIADTAGAAVRLANSAHFDIEADITRSCRKQCLAAVVLANDGNGPVHDGRIAFTLHGAAGAGQAIPWIKTSGSLHNVIVINRR